MPFHCSLPVAFPAPAILIISLNDKEIFHLTTVSHSSIMRLLCHQGIDAPGKTVLSDENCIASRTDPHHS